MQIYENISFLIIFTVPAAIHILYHTYIRFNPRKTPDKSVELAECLLFSAVTQVFNIIIFKMNIQKYVLLFNNNYDVNFIIHFFIITFGSSILLIVLWYGILLKLFYKVINIINTIFKRPTEMTSSTVWNTIFHTKDLGDINNKMVAIYKGDQLITAGLLQLYDAPQESTHNILLYSCDHIKEILNDDKGKEITERIFECSESEYYDFDTGTLLKFYNLDKYDQFRESKNK